MANKIVSLVGGSALSQREGRKHYYRSVSTPSKSRLFRLAMEYRDCYQQAGLGGSDRYGVLKMNPNGTLIVIAEQLR